MNTKRIVIVLAIVVGTIVLKPEWFGLLKIEGPTTVSGHQEVQILQPVTIDGGFQDTSPTVEGIPVTGSVGLEIDHGLTVAADLQHDPLFEEVRAKAEAQAEAERKQKEEKRTRNAKK